MLTFPSSHALTDALIAASTDPRLTARLPILLLLHEKAISATEHGIRCHIVRLRHTDADGPDTAIVGRLEALIRDHTAGQGPILDLTHAVNASTRTATGFRMLACAALDDDIVITGDGPHECRRIDAVDIDGRVYQLTQYRTETHPIVTVDDTAEPCDVPAAIPALRAALAAAVHLTSRT
jgi:hypothetical protein